MRQSLLAITLLVTALQLNAQDIGDAPSFEAASIKPTDQLPRSSPGPSPPDRFIRRYITLSLLIASAYEVSAFQIEGAPDWVFDKFFDVEAKADFRPTPDQMRLMVRRLLSERFSLKAHMERTERERYALVKARADGRLGEKLRPSDVDCAAVMAARGPDYRPPPPDVDANGFPRPRRPGEPPRCATMTRGTPCSMTTYVEGTPISRFAQLLQARAGRIVVDKTGVPGTFDIELEAVRPNLSVQPTTQCEGPSLFVALQEQLGLKLEPERGPVDVFVIDTVKLPTPD